MPYDQVMHKFKHGQLHSGSDKGPVVGNRKQAIAIMLSEKKAAGAGKTEYQSKKKKNSIGPSADFVAKMEAKK